MVSEIIFSLHWDNAETVSEKKCRKNACEKVFSPSIL